MYAEDTTRCPVCNLGRDEYADEGAAGTTLEDKRGNLFALHGKLMLVRRWGRQLSTLSQALRLFATYKLGDSSNL